MKKDVKIKKSLCLSGCSTLIYCHLGAIKRLLEQFEFKEGIATSGGSIILSLLACGYSYEQIERIVKSINLKNLYDANWIPFIPNWGLIKGEKLYKVLKEYIPFTFKDLDFDLNIVATKLGQREAVIFNKNNSPNTLIVDAIRASISIPILFDVFTLNGEKYIDGGLINNFAIDHYKDNAIGIRVKSSYDKSKVPTNQLEYLQEILNIMMEALS